MKNRQFIYIQKLIAPRETASPLVRHKLKIYISQANLTVPVPRNRIFQTEMDTLAIA